MQRLALAVLVDEQKTASGDQTLLQHLSDGLGCFGSERRIVSWRKSQSKAPECPEQVKGAILAKRACRLILLTPAYFKEGYLPTWLLQQRDGVHPQLQAIVNRRPQVVSGWDMARGRRKKTRRLLPAGTVLFLKLKGDEADIAAWIDRVWLHCVSDDDDDPANDAEQYRLDGFGLAALGVWSDDSATEKGENV